VKVVGFALVSCSRPPSDSAIRQGEGEADAMPGHVAVRMVAVVGIAAGTADGIAGAALPLEPTRPGPDTRLPRKAQPS
jgi:hypothetical protein